MKKNILLILLGTFLFSSGLYAATYEASTLHNAVSRSETVQDLFFQRWQLIQDREMYFDLYGKLNWVNNFQVKSYNRGNDSYEAVDMTLVRTYGSISLVFPVLGGYDKKELNKRQKRGVDYKKPEEKTGEDTATKDSAITSLPGEKKEEKGTGPFGLWKPKNLLLGFTATGFHYGLTRKTEIDRGDAGKDQVSDYKYSQFFDDIFALSVLYRPYFFIHAGVILNREIAPNEDGTMDYFDSKKMENHSERIFVSSNLLSFLNLNATTTSSTFEAMAIGIEVNNLVAMLATKLPSFVPKTTVTYKVWNYFNDDSYEGVWVKTENNKSDSMPDDEKDHAQLHLFSILMQQNIANFLFIDFFIQFQYPNEKLIEKRTQDDITFNKVKEYYLTIGINLFPSSKDAKLLIEGGISSYWDIGVPVHSKNDNGYSLFGGFVGLDLQTTYMGANVKASYNHSPELRKLIESADKFMLECSMYIRF